MFTTIIIGSESNLLKSMSAIQFLGWITTTHFKQGPCGPTRTCFGQKLFKQCRAMTSPPQGGYYAKQQQFFLIEAEPRKKESGASIAVHG